jgi:uncharacterized protein
MQNLEPHTKTAKSPKRSLLLFSCLMLLSCTTLSAKSYLWQVKGNGINFWIVGVSHTIPKNEFPVPEKINKIFEVSSTVVMEANLAEKSEYKKSNFSVDRYKESDAVGQELLRKGKIHKAIAEEIPRTSTFDLPSLFAQALANFDSDYLKSKTLWEDGFDKQLVKRAMLQGKKLGFLESTTDRDRILDTACSSKEDHLRMTKSLAGWLDSGENVLKQGALSQRLLASGNFTAFEKYWVERLANYEFEKMFVDCLVIPRNKTWINTITSNRSHFDNSLVLVGASHLLGQDNLLSLLELNGFEVTNTPL